MNLVPTASTTAALALGDALAMTLLVAKGFRQEDFANLHPGGKLGKRLMRAEQLMHAGDAVADRRPAHADARGDLRDLAARGLGMTCVVDEQGALVGIITDGDLRRHMTGTTNLLDRTAGDVMTRNPVTIRAGYSGGRGAADRSSAARSRRSSSWSDDQRVQGVVHLHDLWRTEMF